MTRPKLTKAKLKRRIEAAIKRYAKARSAKSYALISTGIQDGKLYEAHVLSVLLKDLHDHEGMTIKLINSSFVTLKRGHGPINPHYPHFDLWRDGKKVAELWTDVTVLSLSYSNQVGTPAPTYGDYHEMDLVIVDPGTRDRPRHDQVWLVAECKDTVRYEKNLLREILGIRRELSFFTDPQPTKFKRWPQTRVLARPASCLMVYSTSAAVSSYSSPGDIFGIDFIHLPLY